jgi:hypothetical protein
MFHAYFALSMDLVRVSVKVMEENMLESFDDDGTKPVSAAFGAPSTLIDGNLTHNEPRQKPPVSETTEISSISHRIEADMMDPSYPDVNIPPKRRVSFDIAGETPTTFDIRPSIPYMRDEDYEPVVESLSQDAIEEMVQQVFTIAGKENQDYLNLDDFRTVVDYDTNILAWC